jgi:uncharacterized protein
MVTRDTSWPPGTPCWVDLAVDDVDAASTFYGALFGWTVPAVDGGSGSPEAGGYRIAHQYGRVVAGLGAKAQEHPAAWITYLATDAADETAAAIEAAGGQLLAEPMDVLGQGRMAVAADPAGAVFGLWQAGLTAGIGLANEPGSLCWSEQHSGDLQVSTDFYRAVFGYEFEELTARSVLLKVAGHQNHVGGLVSAEDDSDSTARWDVYFAVAETAGSAALAQGLGATVVRPAWDTEWGPMVTLADDQGAVFSLCTAPTDG